MGAQILSTVFPIVVHSLALGLLAFLIYRGLWKRLTGVSVYLFMLLVIDAVGRRYVFNHYGASSHEYYYFYWLSDVALELGAFLLVCTFFRRACANEAKLWRSTRLFLSVVFILVLGFTAFSLSRNYGQLFTGFIYEIQQNLYFTCLVLNTMLYILMHQVETKDDELNMMVCGFGLQFAGPAASFALRFLTPNMELTRNVMVFLAPLFTLGMLATWFYAVAQKPKYAKASDTMRLVPAFTGRRQAA